MPLMRAECALFRIRVSIHGPDCGFAPGAGEPPDIDESYEKLRRRSEAARRLREQFPSQAFVIRRYPG